MSSMSDLADTSTQLTVGTVQAPRLVHPVLLRKWRRHHFWSPEYSPNFRRRRLASPKRSRYGLYPGDNRAPTTFFRRDRVLFDFLPGVFPPTRRPGPQLPLGEPTPPPRRRPPPVPRRRRVPELAARLFLRRPAELVRFRTTPSRMATRQPPHGHLKADFPESLARVGTGDAGRGALLGQVRRLRGRGDPLGAALHVVRIPMHDGVVVCLVSLRPLWTTFFAGACAES